METARSAIPITDADLNALKGPAEKIISRLKGKDDLEAVLKGLSPDEPYRTLPVELQLVYDVRHATCLYIWLGRWLFTKTGQEEEAKNSSFPTDSILKKQKFSSAYAMFVMASYLTKECDDYLKGKTDLASVKPNYSFEIGRNFTADLQMVLSYYVDTLQADNGNGISLIKKGDDIAALTRDFWKSVAERALNEAQKADAEIQSVVGTVTFKHNDFVISGFKIENGETQQTISFSPVQPDEVVGNTEAIIMLLRLGDRIALYDPVLKKNPMCEIGGVYESNLLDGPPGTGKAQPLSSKLLTPTGWKLMGEIKIGDYVAGSDGSFYPVTGVFPQGRKIIYNIKFDDGSNTNCCIDHLWATKQASNRFSKNKDQLIVSSLRYLLETLHSNSTGEKRRNHSIPWVQPIQFAHQELSLHPYLMGVYLAEGSFTGSTPRISNADADVIENLRQILPLTDQIKGGWSNGLEWSISKKESNSHIKSSTASALLRLGLYQKGCEDKFIPKEYLYNDIAQRVLLLQGLVDGDGSVDKSGIDYSTVSSQLKDDIIFLVGSLGGRATFKIKKTFYTYKGQRLMGLPAYRIRISFPTGNIIPCRSIKHLTKYKKPSRNLFRFIEKIEQIGIEECQCIMVESPDHLYVTDNFILTHNTTLQRMAMTRLAMRAEQVGLPYLFKSLEAKDIKSEWYGKSGKMLAELIDAVLDPSSISLLLVDDIDLLLANRDDPGSGGADKDLLKGLMDFFSGIGTNYRGNYSSIAATNKPTGVDDALRQRFVYRVMVTGAETWEDYADLVALQLKKPLKYGIVKIEDKGYTPLKRVKPRLLSDHKKLYNKSGAWADIGHEILELHNKNTSFTARSVKNAMDVVISQAGDFEVPEEWFTKPEVYLKQPWETRINMIKELYGTISADAIINSITEQFNSEVRYNEIKYVNKK